MRNTPNEYRLLASVYRQLGREYAATDSLLANRYFEDARYIEVAAERKEPIPSDHLRKIALMLDTVRQFDRQTQRANATNEGE